MSLSTGLSDLAGGTNCNDAANAAAAAANFNINPAPAPVFHPQMNTLPAAPPAEAVHVGFRAADRSRKQKILSARQKDLLHDRWAEKERLQQLEENEQKRQRRLQALAAAQAAAKVQTEARKLKAQAQRQKAAATRAAAAAAAAAATAAEAVATGATAGGVDVAASSAAAGGEAAGISGLGVGAVGASTRDRGGAAAPPTQPIGRASTRRRVPNRRFQDEANKSPRHLPHPGTFCWGPSSW